MAYLPSHQTLATHPKTRKAARRLAVSLPTMIGHLHMLWYWALDHAPDGDLSKFDADDLADAAGWEGDPDELVKALTDCGPGDSSGFLEDDRRLHDWDEYGGKYGKRVEAARKAAAARWQSDDDANASEEQCDRNATASGPYAEGNAEERRGEDREPSSAVAAVEDSFDRFWQQYPRGKAGKPGGDGPRKPALQKWRRLKPAEREACLTAVEHYRAHVTSPDGPIAAHAVTWLNQERWEDWQDPVRRIRSSVGGEAFAAMGDR